MTRLRTTPAIAVIGGGLGSVALFLYAAWRVGAPQILIGLFTIWVLSPFVLLVLGHAVSERWSTTTRAALDAVTVAVAITSVAVYGFVALGRGRPATAPFVVVAPFSWLLIAVVVSVAAAVSRRSNRADAPRPAASVDGRPADLDAPPHN